ncbi:beta-ketoacyl-ACP synthase I [Acinetobacter baumannii ATCC 17978]|nr:beta-ketoacyl-ACP synthase I [Acinetobacter baumannii ATCC 17978]
MGINSCIGNSLEEVTHSLKNGISGTRFNPTYAELNFKSHVSAAAEQDFDNIDRKLNGSWAYVQCTLITLLLQLLNMLA